MEKHTLPKLKKKGDCSGCGACIAVCPKDALKKKKVGAGAWIPEADKSLCARCGLCERTCLGVLRREEIEKRAYIAYNQNRALRLQSASGGIFSGFATRVLEQGGCVFGAELTFEGGKASVKHRKVERVEELPAILGSKYVQSDCVEAYKQAKQALSEGRKVLFCACSCQIAGLKKYLQNVDQSQLFTLDLVCHGTPSLDFFNRYVAYLSKKYQGEVVSLSFRTKVKDKILYQITAKLLAAGEEKEVVIPIRKSGYYRMFIEEQSYRKACYQCPYASLEKPADITVGDYFEAKKDYPEYFEGEDGIDCADGISCLITHTKKGAELLEEAREGFFVKEVDPKVAQKSHKNLYRPSKHTATRGILFAGARIFGYSFVEKWYAARNKIVDIIKGKR